MKNTSGKIHQKSNFFFGILFCTSSGASEKNAIISHTVDAQNIVIFSTSEAKKRQKFDPLRHNQNKYPRKGNMSSGELGFFETKTAQT